MYVNCICTKSTSASCIFTDFLSCGGDTFGREESESLNKTLQRSPCWRTLHRDAKACRNAAARVRPKHQERPMPDMAGHDDLMRISSGIQTLSGFKPHTTQRQTEQASPPQMASTLWPPSQPSRLSRCPEFSPISPNLVGIWFFSGRD